MLETFQRTAEPLQLNRDEFAAVLGRVGQDAPSRPRSAGAAAGILWTLGLADEEQILADLLTFADPNELGDFLAGLFALAREVAQRNPRLVGTIDRLLLEFNADDFQAALPSLRLAFTYFTPREKHYMLTTLFESLGLQEVRPLAVLRVDETTAAERWRSRNACLRSSRNMGWPSHERFDAAGTMATGDGGGSEQLCGGLSAEDQRGMPASATCTTANTAADATSAGETRTDNPAAWATPR